MANMFARWKFQIALIAMIAVFAVLPGASRDEPVAYAHHGEDRDYVDVGLTLEVPEDDASAGAHKVHVIVVNHGTRTAYDVVVDVNVETLKPTGQTGSQTQSFFSLDLRGGTEAPVGHISVGETGDGKSTFRWTIPRLHGLQREVVIPVVDHATNENEGKVHKISGTVTTTSFQSDIHKENDDFEVWTYAQNTRNTEFIQVGVNYSVSVSVDNPFPARGDTVNFTITAGRSHTHPDDVDPEPDVPPPIDLKVDIETTEGLTVGTPSRYYTTNSSGVQTTVSSPDWAYSMGRLDIGTGVAGQREVIAHSMTLPVTVGSGTDAVVNEQCLTATLTGNPPPGTGPLDDEIADNVAKLCLGDPVEPFASGQVDAFTIYPCVGVTDAPCDNSNDIRVRAVYGDTPLPSGTAVFWLDPQKARIYDPITSDSVSVNDGNTVSWQTADGAGGTGSTYSGVTSGVELFYSRTPYKGRTGWAGLTLGIAARDVTGNDPPGKVSLRFPEDGFALRTAKSPNFQDLRTAPTGSSTSANKSHYFLEFEKLGTYKFTWYAYAKRSTLHGSENCSPTSGINQVFCASETYTFHVGPMADRAIAFHWDRTLMR